MDKVLFQGITYNLPSGHSEAEIRAALSEQAPAIMHAALAKFENTDGTTTWEFSEQAGTKG
jgi:hypothetical protein